MDDGGILMRNEKIEISSLPRNESVIISLFRIFIHEKLDESLPGPSNDVILFMKNETSSIFRRERKKKALQTKLCGTFCFVFFYASPSEAISRTE